MRSVASVYRSAWKRFPEGGKICLLGVAGTLLPGIFALPVILLLPSEPARLLEARSCQVLEQLYVIQHTSLPKEPDRFLSLALAGKNQSYVQCLFGDDGVSMLCEAASGFYGPWRDEKPEFQVAAAGQFALAELGFAMDGNEGNYQQILDVDGPEDLPAVAEMMLTALQVGYGAQAGSDIRFKAPLVPPGVSVCGAASAAVEDEF